MEKIRKVIILVILIIFLIGNNVCVIGAEVWNEIIGRWRTTNITFSEYGNEEIGRKYEIKDEKMWDVSKKGDVSVVGKWSLKNKTLVISGKGEMCDWERDSVKDWHNTQYSKMIEKIVIEEGITNISNYAFCGCSNVTSIEINSNILSIGFYAFDGCINLTNIEIPNSVNTINLGTFEQCESLTSIYIPSSVTKIEENAFNNCSNLKSIEIDKNNQSYVSIGGVLYSKDVTSLVRFPPNKEDTMYIIPNSVEIIREYAFCGCNNLIGVEIPNSVVKIAPNSFSDCNSLKSLIIPESVTDLGYCALEYCKNLESVELLCDLTTIEDFTFRGCYSLINIEIPSSVTKIAHYAFKECTNLKNIEIPNTVNSIEESAFDSCEGPIICKTNSEAHKYAEREKIGYILTDSIANNVGSKYMIKEEESWDISKDEDGSIVAKWKLEDQTLVISGNGEMYNWSSSQTPRDWHETIYSKLIKKVVIENGITNIPYWAFDNCKNLSDIEIPESVTRISGWAFAYCSNLKNIEIPRSVTYLDGNAFQGCKKLTNINIPNTVEWLNAEGFDMCNSLTSIEVESNNPNYVSVEGVLYNKDMSKLLRYPQNKKENVYIIPNTVSFIEDRAFSNCSNLKEVKIPESVTNIGERAFHGCDSLESVNIPNSVTEIEDAAFYMCGNLKNVKIPNSVTKISRWSFANCGLTSIEIPENIIQIEEDAFYFCSNLKNIEIQSYIESIDKNAFKYCNGPIICNTNSEAHRYAESEEIGYILKKLIGDVNENGQIDFGDILLLLRHISYNNSSETREKHPEWKLSEIKEEIGDVNKNNKIDVGDILKLQRYIAAMNDKNIAEKYPKWIIL